MILVTTNVFSITTTNSTTTTANPAGVTCNINSINIIIVSKFNSCIVYFVNNFWNSIEHILSVMMSKMTEADEFQNLVVCHGYVVGANSCHYFGSTKISADEKMGRWTNFIQLISLISSRYFLMRRKGRILRTSRLGQTALKTEAHACWRR